MKQSSRNKSEPLAVFIAVDQHQSEEAHFMHTRTFIGKILFITMIGTCGAHASSSAETDRQLTQQVELLIRKQPEFSNQLTVQARNGVIYIGGTPWTQFDVPTLEPMVRQIQGVTGVVVTAVYPEN